MLAMINTAMKILKALISGGSSKWEKIVTGAFILGAWALTKIPDSSIDTVCAGAGATVSAMGNQIAPGAYEGFEDGLEVKGGRAVLAFRTGMNADDRVKAKLLSASKW